MSALAQVRAHGGQGATAGHIAAAPQVHAILRGTTRTIRVWNGCAGKREEFTIGEARALCVEGDRALLEDYVARAKAMLVIDDEEGRALLTVRRDWLIAFLAALRKALRTNDAACEMAMAAQLS